MQETISPRIMRAGEIWQPFYRQPFAERMRAGRSSASSGSVHAAEFRPILGPRPSPTEHEATVIEGLKHPRTIRLLDVSRPGRLASPSEIAKISARNARKRSGASCNVRLCPIRSRSPAFSCSSWQSQISQLALESVCRILDLFQIACFNCVRQAGELLRSFCQKYLHQFAQEFFIALQPSSAAAGSQIDDDPPSPDAAGSSRTSCSMPHNLAIVSAPALVGIGFSAIAMRVLSAMFGKSSIGQFESTATNSSPP
jgi:hypothetical protein